jgi:hypothetical protein
LQKALDAGANEGLFARLLSNRNVLSIAADSDPYVVDALYRDIREGGEKKLIPLMADLSHPSPAFGLNNEELASFNQRGRADLVLALAVIHHLVIGKNVPLELTAKLFSCLGPKLIIEFVPKDDEKVVQMLMGKKDIYPQYTETGFRAAYADFYHIEDEARLPGSKRVLFLLKRK